MSTSLSCSDVANGGATTLLSGGSAVFQVLSQNVTTFYFCDSQTYVSLTSIQFEMLTIDPRYAIRNVVTHISFPLFTPNGTMSLREYSDCSGSIGGQQALSSTKTVDVAFSVSGYYFVCLTYFDTVVARSVTTNINSFVVTDPSSFTPQTAITFQTLSFEISGAAPPNARVFFSLSTSCNVTSQGSLQAGGSFGKTVSTRIVLPSGNFTFCVEIPMDSGVYVPSGVLNVGQYFVHPFTAYAGRPTTYTAQFNTQGVSSTVALSSSTSCISPFVVVSSPTNSMVNWTLATGTYYSCIFNVATQSYILASQHTVVASPTVSFLSQAVRALPLSVQSTVSSIILGAAVQTPTIVFNLSGGLATQIVPPTASTSLTIWVPTSDFQYWYNFGQTSVRNFALVNPPIFVGEPFNFTVDAGLWPQYQIRFASASTCVGGEDMQLPILDKRSVLNISGDRVVCVNGSQFGFQAATVTTVYEIPSVSPLRILANKTSSITVFRVPSGQQVVYGQSCDSWQSSFVSVGAQTTISFLSSAATATSFCSTYAGSANVTLSRLLGSVSSLAVTVRPSVQVVNILSTYVVSVADPSLLSSYSLFVSADCSQSTLSSPLELQNGVFIAKVTPTMVGASLNVCVGNSTQGYFLAAHTSIVSPFDVTYSTALAGLPFQLTVVGTTFQPQQYVVSSTRSCNGTTYATGALTNGTGSTRLPLAQSYFVCVFSDDGATLLEAGGVLVGSFSATSTTLVRLVGNQIGVTTSITGANFFLSTFTNCSGTQYVASPSLSAPVGQYAVCQSLGGFASGSTNLVRVIDQFVASAPPSVRSFVPFNVNISRGDSGARSDISVFLSLTNCSGAPLATFTSSNPSFVTITIPTLAFVRSVLCITTADGYVTSQIAEFSPLPYMSPYTIASTVPVSISSGARQSGFAIVSPTSACGSEWMNAVAIQNSISTVTVPRSTSNVGYYCESDIAGQFQLRGVLAVIQLSNGTSQQVIFNQTAFPGVPVVASINTSLVSDPFFSTSSSCSNTVDLSSGYLPSEGEEAYFFVCVLTADQTLRFTTPFPSVHIVGYTIQPKSFVAGSQQSFSLSSAIPSQTVMKVSGTSSCATNVSAAIANGQSGTLWPLATLDGIYYLCAQRGSTQSAIATLLVSRSPQKLTQTLLIPNVPVCVSLQSTSTTFSLIDDSGSMYDTFRNYYSSSNRSFFLSASSTLCSEGSGVLSAATAVVNISSVCLSTSGARVGVEYQFCIGTPSGFVPLGSATFNSVTIQPTVLVSGGSVALSVNNLPSATIALSPSTTCSPIVTSSFTANSSGVVPFFKASASDNSFLSPGTFFVCVLSPRSTWISVGNVSVAGASFYSISNNVAIQQVPTTFDLLDDLTSDVILGLRTSTSCALTSSIASVTTVTSTSISVTGAAPGVAYLCATTPINNSVVVVAAINIISSFAQFSSQASTCTDITVGVNAPGTYTALTLIAADYCCGATTAATLSTASSPSTSQRRFVVTDTDLERFSSRTSFALCASNATSCYSLGQISFVSSSCAGTPTPQTPSPGGNNGNTNGSNSNRVDLVSSTTQESSKKITPTIILAAVFLLLLVIVIIIVLVQCCLRSRRVIPSDVEAGKTREGADVADNEWKRTFDSIVNTNKRGASTAVTLNQLLHVPISMRLDTCREAPIPIQLLELQERDERAALAEIERNTFYKLMDNIEREMCEMREYHAAVEKTRVLQNVSVLLQAEYMSLAEFEEANRTAIMDDEENNRLDVVDVEKQHWRHQVDLEGQRLKDTLERDPFWRNRRRLLREAHMRAMQSVQASPAAFDPTPNRTLMVDQTELESRYNKEQDLYI